MFQCVPLLRSLLLCKIQGGWENDETVEEAARREAIEEAGVKGDLLVRNSNFIILRII